MRVIKCEVRPSMKKMKGKGDSTGPPRVAAGKGNAEAPIGRWKAKAPSANLMQPVQRGSRPQFPAPMKPAAIKQGGYTERRGTMTIVFFFFFFFIHVTPYAAGGYDRGPR